MGPIKGAQVLLKFLTPGGIMDTDEYSNLWTALDGIDVVGTVATFGLSAAAKLTKLGKVGRLAKLGSDTTAGRAVADTLASDSTEVGDTFGLAKLEAAMDAEPMNAA